MPDRRDISRTLAESSPDGILAFRGGCLTYLNAEASRLLDTAPDAAIGRTAADVFPVDRSADLIDALNHLAPPQRRAGLDAAIVRRDGTLVEFDASAAAIDDADGPLIQVTLRDVTERRRRERALREREERLTLAFAGAREGVWDWNLETGAVVYSRRWKEMLGYGDDEIEPHVRAWEHLLHPDDAERARAINERVMRGGATYEGEFRLRHRDGHYIVVLSRGFPQRAADGRVVRIVGTHLDITERKRTENALRESEERLTLAFAGAQEGVWDWNLETGAVVYSTHWKRMLGYEDDEIEPHVRAWERLLHPDDMPRALAVHESVMRGARTYEGEFRLRHKDGHYVHVLSRGFPVRRDADGPVVRIVGTHFDLTERKRAEAERARTEMLARMVFAQEDERRRIAREMHDQFGEQLTSLGFRIAALNDACRTHPELADAVAAVERVAQRIDRDVDQLVWELRPTALDDLGLRAALTNYVQDWSTRVGIHADLHTSGLLDDRLPSELETTLYRIAQEALTNVARHSRATHVEVLLERRGDQVLLVVEDDGVGFDRNAGSGPSGFGLVGMQERAALVGATIEIESSPGNGATVLVRMSAAAPAVGAANG